MKVIEPITIIFSSMILCSCSTDGTESFIAGPNEIDKYLQVPSPQWEDQILYFIVTDRFMDGDSSNNDQGQGE